MPERYCVDKMPITTRHEASVAGKTIYWSGATCKHGHRAPRYVSTNGCIDCLLIRKNPNVRAAPGLWVPEALRIPSNLKSEDYPALQRYLQECVDHFARARGLQNCDAVD